MITYQRGHVTLDTTSSQTNDQDSDDEASQTSTMFKRRGNRSANQDEQTNHVDNGEDNDSLILSKVLIGNNSTNNGSDVAPELVEGGKTSGTLMTEAQSTTSLATIQRKVRVVLEQTAHTVVCETFAKFDNSDQPGGDGQVLRNMAQALDFILGGLFAIRGRS